MKGNHLQSRPAAGPATGMNTFVGLALSAFVVLAPAVSQAASVNQAASQPQSAATTSAPPSTPYAALDYQNGTQVTPVSPVSRSAIAPLDSTAVLMNQTGGGR
jgi:hypothetical protein